MFTRTYETGSATRAAPTGGMEEGMDSCLRRRGGWGVGFRVCLVGWGGGRRWKVRGSGARGGGPACDYPTWPCCGGRGEWGVLVHKPALDHSEGWGAPTHFRRWVGGDLRRERRWSLLGARKAPSQPCIEGLVYSRAMRIALTRTRRMNGASSRLVTQAYILLRVDGPSIA